MLLTWPAADRPAEDAAFDVRSLTATPLRPRTLQRTEREGIVTEEVRLHSEQEGGKDVDMFACFSYPRGGRKLPASVWNPRDSARPARAKTGYQESIVGLARSAP